MGEKPKIVDVIIKTDEDSDFHSGNYYKQEVIGVKEDGTTTVIESKTIHKDELGTKGYKKQ